MAKQKQRSLELPNYLTRIIPLWQSPQWLEAERWRLVIANQPIAMDCRLALIADILSSQFEIRAKDPKDEDKLADEIEWYTSTVLNPQLSGGLSGFDIMIDQFCQDLLTLPIGGNLETIRFPDGQGPFSTPHGNGGHVAGLVYIDGATLWPTYDKMLPIVQRLKEDPTNPVYFKRNEIARTVWSPRPEIQRWGFGMPPPEAIYLAMLSLYYGDKYYSNLLLDTPEAGLLDLIDMSKDSAEKWVKSFGDLMSGIDPMKIGILYEHEKAAQFLPFGRPPTDLALAEVMLRYAQITCAGFGLTITDIGLGDPQKTLAGTIRDERKARRSGFGTDKEKIRTLMNGEILPTYLEFIWIGVDEETKVQQGRAFLLQSQALEKAKSAGFIDAETGLEALKREGYIQTEAELPEPEPIPPQLIAGENGDVQEELDRVPASEGGREDKAELGDPRISSAPPGTNKFDFMAQVLRQAFGDVQKNMTDEEIRKLVFAATRLMFPVASKAMVTLSDTEIPLWQAERVKLWFGEQSEFSEMPNVVKAGEEVLERLDAILDKDKWWKIPGETEKAFDFIMQLTYEEGAVGAAELVRSTLYQAGKAESPDIIGLNFNLKNPRTLKQLEKNAAQLVTRVDDGTKFFIKRIVTSGVDEGLASPSIAAMIREGAGVEEILADAGYTEGVIKRVKNEVIGMTEQRTNSIANTEIARAETDGRLGQWRAMGLKKKDGGTEVKPDPATPAPSVTETKS